MKSIELVICIGSGYYAGSTLIVVHFSDYAVGVFAYQKMIYNYLLKIIITHVYCY